MVRTLRRSLGSQFRVSRNLGETFGLRCRRTFWATVYLVKGLRCAINMTRTEQLGSTVIFEGQRCFISNWANSAYPTIAGPCGYRQNVPREQLTNVVNGRELWHRFNFGLSFYMGNWHDIDVCNRLYPRLREFTARG